MSRTRQPYNPALAEYQQKQAEAEDLRKRDRRATSFSKGIAAHMSALQVDNPEEPGYQIVVLRNTRNDPLAGMHARKFIDEAQYHAGRAFQHDFEIAERGPRAIDPGKEAVDGGRLPEPLGEAQQAAFKRLAGVHSALGMDGSAIVSDVLVHGLGISQLATRRGYQGEHWRKYFGRRFNECLDRLALLYGFAT
jgi:Domain of unknown function (DUF6456)